MTIGKKEIGKITIGKLIWISVGLGALYWVLDSALDSFVFHSSTFMSSFLTPEPMCLVMRMINWAIITTFAIYAQLMLSKRRLAEKILKKERDKAQGYLDVSPVMMLAVERDQCVSLMNRTGCAMLGCKEQDILGKNWFDTFVPEPRRDSLKKNFEQSMASGKDLVEYSESPVMTKTRGERLMAWRNSFLTGPDGEITAILSSGTDITSLKKAEQEREKLIRDLQGALAEVKKLGSLLPICASCKKIRDDKGYWHQVEEYITKHSDTKFSHGICPECSKVYYAELARLGLGPAENER